MTFVARLAGVFLACLCLPAAAQVNPWEAHFNARMPVIDLHARTAGKGGILALGDSNSEMFWWTENAGCRVINGGFGGARIADIALRATAIAAATEPKIVHVMLGTNNLSPLTPAPEWEAMSAHLTSIVAAFHAKGSKVVLWPVPPTSPSFAPSSRRSEINSVIQQVALDTGAYWDWWWPLQITGADGYALPGALIEDGVHLSPASQVSRYYRMQTWRSHAGVTCP